MVIRIVNMYFKPEKADDFLVLFNQYKKLIRATKGCTHLELLNNKNDIASFSTYSLWENIGDLEEYRSSDLFNEVWVQTKKCFSKRPEAFSYEKYMVVH